MLNQQPQAGAPQQGGSNFTASDGTQLDPTAATLTRSIRQVETGGNYDAKGASGEHGAYQFMPGNFQAWAKQYGLDGNDFSPVNQDKVAYARIHDLLQQGHTQSQVASIWNSGSPDWEGKVGTNKFGVKYDVPGYVNKVKQAYQGYVSGNPPTGITKPQPGGPQGEGDQQAKDPGLTGVPLVDSIANFLFPIAGDIKNDITGKSTKGFGQQAADLGLSALPFIPGIGEVGEGAGLLTKLLGNKLVQGGLVGAAAGGLGAISQGGGASDALKGAGLGAVTGAGIGGVAGALGGVLPRWITQAGLKVDPKTAQYALETKGIGTLDKLASKSSSAQKAYEAQINNILTSDAYKASTGGGKQVIQDMLGKFPNGDYKEADISRITKRLLPTQKALVDRVVSGEATLVERNALRKALDKAVSPSFYKTGARPPTAEQQQIGKAMSDLLRGEVQKTAPETTPVFQQYHLENNLQTALRKLQGKKPGNLVTFRDLVATLLGQGAFGPIGGAIGYGAEKLSTTPGGQFALAKTLRGVTPIASKVSLLGATRAATAPQQ